MNLLRSFFLVLAFAISGTALAEKLNINTADVDRIAAEIREMCANFPAPGLGPII